MNDETFRPAGPNRPSAESSGGGWKILLYILLGVGGVSFLCCLGIGFSFYSMMPKIENDPAIVAQQLNEILTIELLEGYTPDTSFTMNMFSVMKVKAVVSKLNQSDGVLVVGKLEGSMANDPSMKKNIQDAINDQTGNADIQVENKETRTFEISGQQVDFEFVQGTMAAGENVNINPEAGVQEVVENLGNENAETPEPAAAETPVPAGTETNRKQMRQVTALIPSSNGAVLFFLITDEEHWNEANVVKMIESIKLPE